MTWIYYPGRFNSIEFLPLVFTLALLFGYVYFMLKKMDLLRSRLVLAIAALLTICGSLVMSLGFCFFFGLTLSNQLKGVLPYLVVLVGLENVLVITKCVLSTDQTLDVKIRVARGLSKEGWSIAKTLLTEITILTVGLATFVPFIQEFCLFAIVALISDFLLQMLLFSTILAMDIRPYNHHAVAIGRRRLGGRRERAEDEDADDQEQESDEGGAESSRFLRYSSSASGMSRSQSHPKLSSMDGAKDVIATRGDGQGGSGPLGTRKKGKRIPKRVRLVNWWARTRFFQRCFMVWMIVWISSIVYNSGVIENYFDIRTGGNESARDQRPAAASQQTQHQSKEAAAMTTATTPATMSEQLKANDHDYQRQLDQDLLRVPQDDRFNYTETLRRLQFPADYETRDAVSPFHWSSVLKRYNISLTAKYISILPSIRVTHLVTPAEVVKLRNPHEQVQRPNFQWKALAAALDPIDFSDVDQAAGGQPSEGKSRKDLHQYPYGTPLYPKSPMELFFAAILICISVFVLTYTLIVMYRCICTRNYAEWRASWTDQTAVEEGGTSKRKSVVQNSVPISIRGHHQSTIECLASDGALVASSCLEGRINVWDVTSGMRVSSIPRRRTTAGEDDSGRGRQIWCLDFVDNLVAVGCADGRLEFWEGSTGYEKVSERRRDFESFIVIAK